METGRSCFAKLLDVRTFVMAVRQAYAGVDAGTALVMVLVFGLIGLALTPLYISYDLSSTWEFTTGLREGSRPAIADTTETLTGALDRAGVPSDTGLLGLTVGAALAGVVGLAFTLLPSFFELAFPTITHPLLMLVLYTSIIFDYVTDWSKSWGVAGAWTSSPVLQFLYTVVLNLFFSVGVQALLVICLTAVICGCITIMRGGVREVKTIVVQQ